ncbi:MAG TPA: hypothetical protein VF518_16950 [Polyangia bacterium]
MGHKVVEIGGLTADCSVAAVEQAWGYKDDGWHGTGYVGDEPGFLTWVSAFGGFCCWLRRPARWWQRSSKDYCTTYKTSRAAPLTQKWHAVGDRKPRRAGSLTRNKPIGKA